MVKNVEFICLKKIQNKDINHRQNIVWCLNQILTKVFLIRLLTKKNKTKEKEKVLFFEGNNKFPRHPFAKSCRKQKKSKATTDIEMNKKAEK